MPSFTHFSHGVYRQVPLVEDSEKGTDDAASEDSSTPLISRREELSSFSIIVLLFCTISIILLGLDIWLHLTTTDPFKVNTPIPEIPYTLVRFDASEEWLELPSPESNARWMAELGPSDGFTGVSNPRQYNEKPGIMGVGGENYGVSVFHGLHCLVLIRQAWHEARIADDLNVTYARTGLDITYGNLASGHVAHCFDYLRNAIKCGGDTTLEWALEPGSRKLDAMAGEVHVCKDFKSTRAYMDSHLPFPKPK